MSGERAEFRNPNGPVAKIYGYLDKRSDAIKAGVISRRELIEAMVAKGWNAGTVATQCGHWARNNGITFARPTEAEAARKAARAKASAKAKKAKLAATAAA